MEDNTQQGTNICTQCEGVKCLDWTIRIEEGRPMTLRPNPEYFLKLCPGHPAQSLASQEGDLNDAQRYSIMKLRDRITAHALAEIEAFHSKHENIRLEWDFTVDAFPKKKIGEADG